MGTCAEQYILHITIEPLVFLLATGWIRIASGKPALGRSCAFIAAFSKSIQETGITIHVPGSRAQRLKPEQAWSLFT